ncbi:MAG: acetyl-CoA decarbonylase/synthase complex subunit gamma [Syntrophobacteraceae bacterium]
MGMTGIQIFKLLPKTNCGDCGVPTCLAFAMNLAAGKAELSACPHVSEDAKNKLAAESAPPIRPLTMGVGENAVKVGGETVLFRHEKTFVNPPGFAAVVSTSEDDASVDGKIARFKACRWDRVGLTLKPEMFAVKDAGDAAKFTALAKKVAEAGATVILMSDNVDALKDAAGALKDSKPLIYAATAANADAVGAIAKEVDCPVVAKGDGTIESVIALTEKLTGMGLKDIVIDTGSRDLKKVFQEQIVIRRAALKDRFRPLGFPTIVMANEIGADLMEESLVAATAVSKYGGVIVMSDVQPHSIFPLLLDRLNIYTDPQRPMTAEQGIYPIGNPDANSPVLVTCNFSLTFFIVSGEIEASRVPTWLLVQDTEGLSVMTAWAAGKFSGESVGTFFNKCGIKDKISHKKLVIPGYAAGISGELEEEISGYKVVVGPREASQIAKFLKLWTPE